MSNNNSELCGEWGYSDYDSFVDDAAEAAYRRQQELAAEGWTELTITAEQDTVSSGTYRLRGVPPPKKVVVSSPIGFSGTTIRFEEVAFPSNLAGYISYVGHPATRSLLEALGATTDTSGGNGALGKWAGPEVGESYLAVPLAQNARTDGWTANVAIESVAALKAIRCTRVE